MLILVRNRLPGKVLPGFVLGPLLFNIYVNDLHSIVKYSKYLLFFDLDIYNYFNISELSETIQNINIDIKFIDDWVIRKELTLNHSKTK